MRSHVPPWVRCFLPGLLRRDLLASLSESHKSIAERLTLNGPRGRWARVR